MERPQLILDAGVGSGLVAERVLDRLPDARLVGVDFSGAMLERAADRLSRFEDRVELVDGDLSNPGGIPTSERFDCAFSVQTLHNIPSEGQRAALRVLSSVLAPGRAAFLLDKVEIPTAFYDSYGVVMELPESAATFYDEEMRSGEHSSPLEAQLAWLADAGFVATVLDVRGNYALVGARTAAA